MDDQKTTFLTQDGLKKIKQEMAELKKKIPEIAERIDKAKELGDLSENAEYHEAREAMAFAKGRVEELENLLNKATIVDKAASLGVIGIGSILKVKNNKGKESEYQIVGSNEANPLQGKISNESPLAQSFLGHKKGDRAEVKTPVGTVVYTILEVK